jgi:glycosyltransferase 2 family protein
VLAAQAVGVMVPAGPGMVGTSQFFTQAGLSIFVPGALSVPEVAARAAGYANSIWMLQFGQQVVLGLFFWVAGRVSLAGVLGPDARRAALPQESGSLAV